jgi:hypothetical protein
MRTRGIDAFAAPVGDFAHRERCREKRRKSRTRNIAVGCRCDPARDQAERHGALAGCERAALGGVLEIEQAQIILAALADDHLLFAFGRIGIKPRQLLHDLALQIAGVGRNPQARAVLLRPQAGGREIAQRLADARSGFKKHHLGSARGVARSERIGRRFGIVPLLGARLARIAHQLRETRARFADRHGKRARLGGRRGVFPLGKRAPHFEACNRRRRFFRFARRTKY